MVNLGKASDTILVVDDDATFASTLARALKRRGFNSYEANSAEQALSLLPEIQPQKIVLDLKLAESSGLHLLQDIKSQQPGCHVIILTGYSSVSTAVEAIKLGATNYLCKPASVTDILCAFNETEGNPETPLSETPPSIDRIEWEHIQKVLAENDNNISATARQLGMHRRTLQRKLQKRPVKR